MSPWIRVAEAAPAAGGSVRPRGHEAAPAPCWPWGHGVLCDTLGRVLGDTHGLAPWHRAACHPGHGARGQQGPERFGPRSSARPWAGRAPCGEAQRGDCPARPCCRDSCHRHLPPSGTDTACPRSEQLWPSALWLKETVLRVQEAEHPPWKCPPLLSSLQQTCLHCSLTFFFLYFYFCMSFAFQIL